MVLESGDLGEDGVVGDGDVVTVVVDGSELVQLCSALSAFLICRVVGVFGGYEVGWGSGWVRLSSPNCETTVERQ